MQIEKILISLGFIAWYLPVLTFRKNKYFYYFFINSLVDPLYFVLRYELNLELYNYFPIALLTLLLTLPVNSYKLRTVSFAVPFTIIIILGRDSYLELIFSEVILSLMAYCIIINSLLEIKRSSVFSLFHLLILLYFLRNAVFYYVFYSNKIILNEYYLLFLYSSLIIIPILLVYFGPNKKIKIDKNSFESLPLLKEFYSELTPTNQIFKSNTIESEEAAEISGCRINYNTPIYNIEELSLTEREYEVLWLVGRGFTNKETAEKLFLSKSSVNHYRVVIKEKLGISKRTEYIEFIEKHQPEFLTKNRH